MKPSVITDCDNCLHKEVCCMKFAPQKTLKALIGATIQHDEKVSETIYYWLEGNKMEISIRCPYYMPKVSSVLRATPCSATSNCLDKSE